MSIGLLDRADTAEVETGLSSRASATVSLSVCCGCGSVTQLLKLEGRMESLRATTSGTDT